MDSHQQADGLTRRGLLGAGAAGLAAAAAGPAAAQDAPFDGYLSDTSNFDGVVDRTGNSEVRVTVGAEANGGGFGFGPAAVRVDPGTSVVWEWNGEGGAHNVVAADGSFDSGAAVAEAGTTFSHTFESAGIVKYACEPHEPLGMKGVVVVGDVDVGGGSAATPTGTAAPQTPTTMEVPDLGGFLDGVGNYDGTIADRRGQDSVEVTVGAAGNGGAFAFGPPAIHVDAGTTVTWQWNGEGGAHNVVATDGTFDSGGAVAEAGTTFEYTFEDDGLYTYVCEPHEPLGMKGVVLVGTDYPTKTVTVTPAAEGPAGTPTPTPEPTAGTQTAAQTLVAMLALGFLSPIAFALLLRWRGRGGDGGDSSGG